MASKFQSRLVGTIIVVAIGIIVLPDVFDGKKQRFQEEFASIPIKPEALPEAEIADIVEPVEFSVELPSEPVTVTVDENDTTVVTANKVESKNEYDKNAWVIQLATFSNLDNAKNLVKKLRKEGFQAHIYPKQPKEGEFSRVVVGPNISKEQLEQQMVKIEKKFKLKGQMLKFNPLNP
jgi:DedD protein